jgi:hypothetical protein
MEPISVFKNDLKVDIEPIVLSETSTTRVVVKAEKYPNSGLNLEIIHQKKRSRTHWEDETKFDKRTLKPNEYVHFKLDTQQTQKLLEALPKLSAIANTEINRGKNILAVVDASKTLVIEGKEKETIESLLKKNSQDFWDHLATLKPDQLNHIAIQYKHQKYQDALAIFEKHLDSDDWDEEGWEAFFYENKWIFGHGLDYRIMGIVRKQPHYGGVNYTGKGGQKGDRLMSTEANVKFTVLVEIKKPQTSLLETHKVYRNSAYRLGKEVVGGIAQLQINCRTWDKSAEKEDNDDLRHKGIYTCDPKGILIVGNTKQLNCSDAKESREKRTSFELFRQNLNNPEIITFDEIYERAKFIVGLYQSETTI